MAAKILKCDKDKVYIEIEIKLTNSMLETENIILILPFSVRAI